MQDETRSEIARTPGETQGRAKTELPILAGGQSPPRGGCSHGSAPAARGELPSGLTPPCVTPSPHVSPFLKLFVQPAGAKFVHIPPGSASRPPAARLPRTHPTGSGSAKNPKHPPKLHFKQSCKEGSGKEKNSGPVGVVMREELGSHRLNSTWRESGLCLAHTAPFTPRPSC